MTAATTGIYRITYISRAGVQCLHPTEFESPEAAEQGVRTLRAISKRDKRYRAVPDELAEEPGRFRAYCLGEKVGTFPTAYQAAESVRGRDFIAITQLVASRGAPNGLGEIDVTDRVLGD